MRNSFKLKAILLHFVFLVVMSGFWVCHADNVHELKLKIKIENWISTDCYTGEPIDNFSGMPLILSTALSDGAQARYRAKINATKMRNEEKRDKIAWFKAAVVGTEKHPWKSFLKLYFTNANGVNLFKNFSLNEYEIPIYQDNKIEHEVKLRRINTVYAIPGDLTNNLHPGKYEAYIIYDNTEVAAKAGSMDKNVIKSNTLVLNLKQAQTTFEKAQLLFHKGLYFLQLENNDEYFRHNQEAAALCPDFPSPYLGLAMSYKRLGEYEKAKELIDRFINVVKTTPLSYWADSMIRRNTELSMAKRELEYVNIHLGDH